MDESKPEDKEIAVDVLKEIFDAVVAGKIDEVTAGVKRALEAGKPAEDVLNRALISPMDLVGEKFGEGEMFIPQVLWSAKAMQGGMNILKPHFSQKDHGGRGKVIIGTAKGDIHDIGKNLVAIMLEGAGFEVKDLGVDVAPERFVDAAVEEKAQVIAVSALLTTTMQSMGDVMALLRERNLAEVKMIIGGAPVDAAFCHQIGAHAYGVDAMDGVRKIRGLVGKDRG